MTRYEIADLLVNEAEYSQEQVDQMDGWDLINSWLEWEGIVGYTTDVITAVLSVNKGMDLSEWEED